MESLARLSQIQLWLLTKRAYRIRDCLPRDWSDGWDNVSLNVTAENQARADERLPILLDIPAKHKGVMIAPFIGKVDLETYLAAGQLETVFADGENYDGARPLHYEWVKLLYEQCRKYDVPFSFFGTGNVFIKDGKKYYICKAYQHVQALRSGLQYPAVEQEIPTVKDTKSNITTSRLYIFACCCIFLLPVLFHAKQSAIRLFDNLVALYRSLI